MTALRRRMLEDMQVRHLSAGTQQVYLQHIARFARYCGRSPAVLGPEEIRAYQLHLTNEKQLTPATLVIVVSALRFPTDRDKERRGIKVSVERDGARVRARQELSFAAADVDQSVDERLARMLRAPMVTQDLPLRVATYAYQATEREQMRIQVAAEVDAPSDVPSPLTMGIVLRDSEGTAVLTRQQQMTATLVHTPSGPVIEASFPLTISPGMYSLRVAVVDAAGQGGSVEHPVHAQVTSSGPLAVGDLVVAAQSSSQPGEVQAPVGCPAIASWCTRSCMRTPRRSGSRPRSTSASPTR